MDRQNNQSPFSLENFDYLKSSSAEYIEDLYSRYLESPDSIDASWRYFFDGIYLGEASTLARTEGVGSTEALGQAIPDELRVYQLIQNYRNYGHHQADVNPLYPAQEMAPELDLGRFGLTEAHLDQTFAAATFMGLEPAPLRKILSKLKKIYCNTVGVELTQLQNATERKWVESRIESLKGHYTVANEDKKFILKRLTDSEALERFIHTRYVAQKRFSIEGGEALIPGLDCIFETASQLGAEEVVLGMAHRGRLNVMVNVFGKKPEYVFTEFDDNYKLTTDGGEGDVKYHKGYSHDMTTRQGKAVHLSLGFNPSHLEFIDPVIMGVTRAKQFQKKDHKQEKVLCVAIHGDAAFSGQGVVYEVLQASQLEGYRIGGTLHIISNNQVGFTTNPSDGRSTRYCSDLARMLDAPIFHVNGDDPEALWHVLKMATEFRYEFNKDVVIDLVCYRRYGHNEGDEPAFTQPLMYDTIKQHPSPRAVYASRLNQESVYTEDQAKADMDAVMEEMGKALELVRAEKPEPFTSHYQGNYWSKYHHANDHELLAPVNTQVSANDLISISKKINEFPNFKVHPKLKRLFDARTKAIEEGQGIDWGNAEVLAYASLVKEGRTIRMSGQDVKRGTFTHRHAEVVDIETGESRVPINALHESAQLHIYNSYLSETAVMGFEFGWSIADPDSLTIWEAQFGDFANGAQVIIDQFLSTSESKWHRASGLTLLLPHGFEGQGPEHSSARLERFLQLCGRNNMGVVYPTTPAQIFHLLRRQVLRQFRKPLIVMTPKSLLRHPKAVSTIQDLTEGSFHEVIDDPTHMSTEQCNGVTRLMICSGKVYYDLLEEREKGNHQHIALIRLEQLYPWPEELLASILGRYSNAKELFFVQEEPRNMGAWMHFQGTWGGALANFGARFPKLPLTYVGRGICASPAVGSKKLHDQEQQEIITRAFQD